MYNYRDKLTKALQKNDPNKKIIGITKAVGQKTVSYSK
jgi:hypothetical protein